MPRGYSEGARRKKRPPRGSRYVVHLPLADVGLGDPGDARVALGDGVEDVALQHDEIARRVVGRGLRGAVHGIRHDHHALHGVKALDGARVDDDLGRVGPAPRDVDDFVVADAVEAGGVLALEQLAPDDGLDGLERRRDSRVEDLHQRRLAALRFYQMPRVGLARKRRRERARHGVAVLSRQIHERVLEELARLVAVPPAPRPTARFFSPRLRRGAQESGAARIWRRLAARILRRRVAADARGCRADIPRRRVAADARGCHVDIPPMNRGDAAAATRGYSAAETDRRAPSFAAISMAFRFAHAASARRLKIGETLDGVAQHDAQLGSIAHGELGVDAAVHRLQDHRVAPAGGRGRVSPSRRGARTRMGSRRRRLDSFVAGRAPRPRARALARAEISSPVVLVAAALLRLALHAVHHFFKRLVVELRHGVL